MALRRPIAAVALLCLPGFVFAQNYVGYLDGASADSTFELGTFGNFYAPSIYNWTVVSGSPQAFTYTNSIMTGGNGNPYGAYRLRYLTASLFAPNTTYTLSFDIGYAAGSGTTGLATYRFDLGGWNGSAFTSLQSQQGTAAFNGNIDASPTFSTTYSFNYTTGASPGTDGIAIEFYQVGTNPASPSGVPDFMSFDNVKLSFVAIPESSTCAAIFGGLALAGALLRRRQTAGAS